MTISYHDFPLHLAAQYGRKCVDALFARCRGLVTHWFTFNEINTPPVLRCIRGGVVLPGDVGREQQLYSSEHNGPVVGYVCVRAAEQNVAWQREAIRAVDRLFSETVSGESASDREEVQEMLACVRDGDTVRIESPDRLARSTTDLLALEGQLRRGGSPLSSLHFTRTAR